MTDKVLITNVVAQKEKYGAHGYRRVRDAVRRLVDADAARGLKTMLVDISNPSQTRKYRASAVSDPRSEVQNKNAIDCIYAAVKPHYLVLLDGPDVIPHILLKSSIPGDEDSHVPSDLPYASDQKFVRRNIAAYASATRVLGRIPGVTGVDDASFLVSQIRTAAAFKSRRPEDYFSHFAISSHLLRKSTERTVGHIFREVPVQLSPPVESPKTRRMLAPLSHFINCDGMEGASSFYGKGGSRTVVSMTSEDIARKVNRGTVAVAECCFGAQLFSPAPGGKLPIANAYLNAGAIAFFGSTNAAYGSRDRNGCADLIARYFLVDVLEGASIGRACLQARQQFVRSQKMEDPVNLKTLAQFILLGDPSLQAVRSEGEPESISENVDPREARQTRRVALAASGESAVDCSGFPGRKIAGGRTRLRLKVRDIAVERGFKISLSAVEGYEIVGRQHYASEMKVRRSKQSVFVAVHREVIKERKPKGVPRTRILVAHAQNDRLTSVAEYIRR